MSKYVNIQNNFLSGMLSPKMRGRTDVKEYFNGAEEIQNMLIYKQGGAYRRPGTTYVLDWNAVCDARGSDTTDSTHDFGLPDFMIPYGEDYLFCGSSASTALPSGGTRVTGKYFLIDKKTGCTTIHTTYGVLDDSALADEVGNLIIEEGKDTGQWNFTTTPGSIPDSLITIDSVLDYCQVGDLLFMTREDNLPVVLFPDKENGGYKLQIVTSQGINTLSAKNTPFEITNITPNRVKVSPTFGGAGLQDVTFNYDPFNGADMYGTMIKLTHGATTGVYMLCGRKSSTVFMSSIIVEAGSTATTDNWAIGSWNQVLGYPTNVSFFQQRLFYGMNERVFGGNLGNVYHFMVNRLAQDASSDSSGTRYFGAVKVTDPVDYNISSKTVNKIKWMETSDVLEVGTDKAEFAVYGGTGAIISNETVNIQHQTSYGNTDIRPAKAGKNTITVSKGKYNIREFARGLDSQTYITRELNTLAEDINDGGRFQRIEYQADLNTLWVLDDNNLLLSCVINNDLEILAWSKHEIGGDDVVIQDIVTFSDSLYLVIERMVNGVAKIYLEKIGLEYRQPNLYPGVVQASDPGEIQDEGPIFCDCAKLIYEVSPKNIVTGLDHLDGATVDVLVDGVLEQNKTVVGGQVTTSASGKEFVVGYPYTQRIVTFPLEAGGAFGSAQGVIKRTHEAYVKFYKTNGASVGTDDQLYPVEFNTGSPTPLQTKDETIKVDLSPSKTNQIVISQTKSLPMNVLALIQRGVTYDQ